MMDEEIKVGDIVDVLKPMHRPGERPEGSPRKVISTGTVIRKFDKHETDDDAIKEWEDTFRKSGAVIETVGKTNEAIDKDFVSKEKINSLFEIHTRRVKRRMVSFGFPDPTVVCFMNEYVTLKKELLK